MRLNRWIGNNLHMLECDVDEVFNHGDLVGIRFTKDDFVSNRPGYHTHDNMPSHPVATLHSNITPVIKKEKCTESRCEGGKYKKNDGSFGICYRCDGLGYITPAKAIKNQQYDKQSAQRNQEPIAFS